MYLRAQEELGALLWICFASGKMFLIFLRKIFFRDFFFQKNRSKKINALTKNIGQFCPIFLVRALIFFDRFFWKKKSRKNIFLKKIKNILPDAKHIQRRAPSSSWSRRYINLKIFLEKFLFFCPNGTSWWRPSEIQWAMKRHGFFGCACGDYEGPGEEFYSFLRRSEWPRTPLSMR